MKTKKQILNSMLLFSFILAVIWVFAIVTNKEIKYAEDQERVVNKITEDTVELSYLSNDFVIYGEPQQLNRWNLKFDSLSDDIVSLKPKNSEQETLVKNIQKARDGLREVFNSIASAVEISKRNNSGKVGQEVIQVSWSRMAIQSQALNSDALRLADLVTEKGDKLRQARSILVYIIMTGLGIFLFVIYSQLTSKAELERNFNKQKISEGRQRNFLAILGHELRNPLAPIVLSLDLLSLKKIEDTEIEQSLETIRHQTDNMSKLIRDLLDISRVERGKIELKQTETDLDPIINNALKAAIPLIDERKQKLQVSSYRNINIFADPLRIEQIIVNILRNASKFSENESVIRLKVETEADKVFIKIKDEGIGIPTNLIDHIFDLFAQLDETDKKSGLGIGLFLARSLARLQGGEVSAYSAGPGKGTEFTIMLPIIPGSPSVKKIGSDISLADNHMKVLVADDNQPLADELGKVLKALNYEARIVYDGLSALKAAGQFQPDIALIDIGLPDLSGLEIARKLREESNSKPLTLIAVSGYGQESDKEAAKSAGFDYYLIKPVSIGMLSDVLAQKDANNFKL